MNDIYKQLREQFTDDEFLSLTDGTKYRLRAAGDFAKGVLEHWASTDVATRARRVKHLEAQAAGLASIVTSKTADTLDNVFWAAFRAAAGESVFAAIKALL